MTITQLEENGFVVLVLEGRLDSNTAPWLDRRFAETFEAGSRRFVWDCAGLTYLSSAGLRSFLQALKRLEAHQGSLAICGAKHFVLDVFDISGFEAHLRLFPDRASALKSLA